MAAVGDARMVAARERRHLQPPAGDRQGAQVVMLEIAQRVERAGRVGADDRQQPPAGVGGMRRRAHRVPLRLRRPRHKSVPQQARGGRRSVTRAQHD